MAWAPGRVTGVVAATALVLAALAAGATSSIGRLGTITGRMPTIQPRSTPVEPSNPASSVGQPRYKLSEHHATMPPWVFELILAIGAVAVLVVILLIIRAAVRSLGGRQRLGKAAAASGAAHEAEPTPEFVEAVTESFEQTLVRLRTGERLDEAILECWRRLEDAASATGLPRDPAQTATEFTVALLRATSARPADLTSLAELYRQAMFSRIPLTGADRERAVASLSRLVNDLAVTPESGTPS